MEVTPLHVALTSGRTVAASGGLPLDWTEQTIGQFCTVKTGPFGTLLKASEYSEIDGVPVISAGEVREGYFRLTEHTPLVPEKVQKRLPQYLLKAGDVVFGRKGAVERSALVRQPQAGWFLGSDGIAVRPTNEHCPEYVAAQFQSFRVRQWLASNSTGTTMASMNQDVLSRVSIPFPPTIAEERLIAQVLTDTNALIDSLEQLLIKKRQIKQGAMQELLAGNRRLPGFKQPWATYRLGDISIITMGRTPARLIARYWGNGNKWLSIADIKGKVISESKEEITDSGAEGMEEIPEGTLLMSFKLTIGRLAFAGCNVYTNEAICALRNPKVDKELLYYALSRVDFSLFGKQAVKGYTLNKESLQNVAVPLPSDPEEQRAIAQVLADLDTEINVIESRLTKARALKQAMAQALLTGRIRLVEPATP